jgi:hypothetical protein
MAKSGSSRGFLGMVDFSGHLAEKLNDQRIIALQES